MPALSERDESGWAARIEDARRLKRNARPISLPSDTFFSTRSQKLKRHRSAGEGSFKESYNTKSNINLCTERFFPLFTLLCTKSQSFSAVPPELRTPFGGLVSLVEFFHKTGLAAKLRETMSFSHASLIFSLLAHTLMTFRCSVDAVCSRFAHSEWLRSDKVLHAAHRPSFLAPKSGTTFRESGALQCIENQPILVELNFCTPRREAQISRIRLADSGKVGDGQIAKFGWSTGRLDQRPHIHPCEFCL